MTDGVRLFTYAEENNMRVFLHAGLIAIVTYFAVIVYAVAIRFNCASVKPLTYVQMGHDKDDFNDLGSGYPVERRQRSGNATSDARPAGLRDRGTMQVGW